MEKVDGLRLHAYTIEVDSAAAIEITPQFEIVFVTAVPTVSASGVPVAGATPVVKTPAAVKVAPATAAPPMPST